MRPRDRRQMEQQTKIEAGDPRATLLAATPAGERSEAAARYDHALEAAELDNKTTQPNADELTRIGMKLWRFNVAVKLSDDSGYRGIVMRYMGGHLVSAGMARAIGQAEAATPFPSDAEILAAWHEGRRLRREYIRQRYGV